MPPLPIAIQLRSLRLPVRRALEAASRLGVAAVEIDARTELRPHELSQTGRREFRKLLENLNLRVAAIGFYTRRGYNVADDLERRVTATKDAMRLAQELGSAVVVNQVGQVPENTEATDWPTMLEALTDIGSFGNRIGATLAAETGSESGDDLARLVAALPDGALGITFNPGNLIINGFSPSDALTALGRNVIFVHAKDGVRDRARGRGDEVPLGRGSADFPALLGTLEDFAYRGYLCIERERAQDPIFEIGQAVEYLASLC
ncbi:MAG TPA: sugar phosphate isomerase/epimerase family protein [Pirellulales bacterium]|jgi:sugar phosphate isomerase/epimerase